MGDDDEVYDDGEHGNHYDDNEDVDHHHRQSNQSYRFCFFSNFPFK